MVTGCDVSPSSSSLLALGLLLHVQILQYSPLKAQLCNGYRLRCFTIIIIIIIMLYSLVALVYYKQASFAVALRKPIRSSRALSSLSWRSFQV